MLVSADSPNSGWYDNNRYFVDLAYLKSIQTSIALSKYRHYSCMRESLEGICDRLENSNDPKFYTLFCEAKSAAARLEAVEYT